MATGRSEATSSTLEPRPLIHIGYHKTGTSWLKRHVFSSSVAGLVSPMSAPELAEVFVRPHALRFSPSRARDHVQERVSDGADNGLIPVLSCERLSGNPHSGGFDSKELADRLHDVLPEARVLVVIREQKDALVSTYKQYVRVGGTRSPAGYFVPPSDLRVPHFSFDHFAYNGLIEYYLDLFGESRLLVLTYELFRTRPDEFVSEVLRFAGGGRLTGLPFDNPANAAPSPAAIAIKRRRNLFGQPVSVDPHRLSVPAMRRVLARLASVEDRVPARLQVRLDKQLRDTVSRLVGTRYRESNQLTAKVTGLDLAAFGYDL